LSFSYWIDYLGFITEGKLPAIFNKPSLGVSNWLVILLHQETQSSFLASLSLRHQQVFLAPLPGKKKTSARRVSHAHPLLCLSFALLYFYLHRFIKNIKKLVSFIVVFTCLLLVLLEWLLLRTLSCVTSLAGIIVILSALLLRHLLLLQIFMRLSLLC
jgi:hypothetical protein